MATPRPRMESRLAVALLNNTVARRSDVAGRIAHSDRLNPVSSEPEVQRALNRHGMVGPMGRVGAASDNAAMGSFFSQLQKNVLDRSAWATRENLRIAFITRIQRTYQRRRRQAALGAVYPRAVRDHHDRASHSGCATRLSPACIAVPSPCLTPFVSVADTHAHAWELRATLRFN